MPRILIVDEETEMGRLVEETLRAQGHSVDAYLRAGWLSRGSRVSTMISSSRTSS